MRLPGVMRGVIEGGGGAAPWSARSPGDRRGGGLWARIDAVRGMGGHVVVLVRLVGCSGAGSCPRGPVAAIADRGNGTAPEYLQWPGEKGLTVRHVGTRGAPTGRRKAGVGHLF